MSSAYRHLDRSSYWRAEFERMKAAVDTLEGENVDLRRQVQGLKEKAGSVEPVTRKKRKRKDQDVVPVPKSPKKMKKAPGVTKEPELPFIFDEHLSVTGLGEAGKGCPPTTVGTVR